MVQTTRRYNNRKKEQRLVKPKFRLEENNKYIRSKIYEISRDRYVQKWIFSETDGWELRVRHICHSSRFYQPGCWTLGKNLVYTGGKGYPR